MLNFLYTLIIFPIEQIIDFCYVFFFKAFKSHGISIMGVSIAVSTLVLPIYLMAEKQQKAEREKQQQMKGEADIIKAVFKGDKRYMLLSTLYRQHNYHPIYALRNSIDLFIQIPFFIAAYHFLHNLPSLDGQSFSLIKNLGSPDGLLGGIHILPILMTLINCVSAAIYTRGFPLKDKIQLYGISAVFLVLLYNSPAALVMYWTCNNIYNLIKNILLKTKHAGKIIFILSSSLVIGLSVYLLFFHHGSIKRRILTVFIAVIAQLFPVWKRAAIFIKKKLSLENTTLELPGKIFFLSSITLFLLIGLVIPSNLIASDVAEFSFLEPFSSPLPYIGITLLQSAGLLFWLMCMFFLLEKKTRTTITFLLTVISGIFLLNSFVFPGNYGYMTPDLRFDLFTNDSRVSIIINIFSMLFICILFSILLALKNKKIVVSFQSIIVVALLCFGIMNIIKINGEFQNQKRKAAVQEVSYSNPEKIYTFTRTGKNVLVIVLDRSTARFVPHLFLEKPELLESYNGFVYYPNTITLGTPTNLGMPCIFGGYYYSPLEMLKRSGQTPSQKYNESMLVLPRILAEANFGVRVQNQPYMDYSLYGEFNAIKAEPDKNYSSYYFQNEINDIKPRDLYTILYNNLLRFSLFKISPLFLRLAIYDNSYYLSAIFGSYYHHGTIDSYISLFYLPEQTAITDKNDNFASMLVNQLTHHPAFMQLPDYKPSGLLLVDRGEGPFAKYDDYHVNMSAFLLLARWFDFLKENDVYNNTRIIIVSDHGRDKFPIPLPDRIILPNGKDFDKYNALLMVKDFNANFELQTDNSFMTNADVPHIATAGLIENVTNPFTGAELPIRKTNDAVVASGSIQALLIGKKNDPWFHVRDDIFELKNWSFVTIEE